VRLLKFVLLLVLLGTTAAFAADYNVRLGLIAEAGHPVTKAAMKFKELVEERSNGRISVQVFPGGQLGGEVELQDQVALGTIQMANIGTPVMGAKLRKLDIFNMYYLWNSRQHMVDVTTGPIGQELWEEYRKATGASVIAANWQQGTRQTITKKPVTTPAEFAGVKIRVTAGVPLYIDLWRAMGASPVPLGFPDAYSGMQTGVVDAVELPLDWMINGGFYKLGKYIDLTQHYFYTNVMLVNDRFLQSLPEDLQQVVRDAAMEAGEYNTELVLGGESELRSQLEAEGIIFVDTDVAAFQKSVEPVFESSMDVWGQDLYERIRDAGQN
jgi:tripartite ATP-independent transporter DctP family solute receptor